MGIFSRLFGYSNKIISQQAKISASKNEQIIANSQLIDHLVFSILYNESSYFDVYKFSNVLQDQLAKLVECHISVLPMLDSKQLLIGWGQHVIELTYLTERISQETLAICVEPAAYSQDEKLLAYKHSGYIRLRYVGYEVNALQQYIALTCVAIALDELKATTIINERAHTSLPIAHFLNIAEIQRLDYIHSLPVLMLFCGFIKYQLPENGCYWLRTYGASRIGLPDFAVQMDPVKEVSFYYNTFLVVYRYISETQIQFNVGDNIHLNEDDTIYLRSATSDEFFLENEGLLLVMEFNKSK